MSCLAKKTWSIIKRISFLDRERIVFSHCWVWGLCPSVYGQVTKILFLFRNFLVCGYLKKAVWHSFYVHSVFTVCRKCDIYWCMQVLCTDWEQYARADARRDRDRKNDSLGEPSGAWPVLHIQHHPHSVLLGNIQGLFLIYFTATVSLFGF